MPKGGYIIIDFKGVDLAGDSVKIDGIFRAVTNAYKKAVQITGIVIDGVEYPDAFVAIKSSVLEVYGFKLKVASDDSVTSAAINDSTIPEKQIETIVAGDAKISKNGSIIALTGTFYSTEAIADQPTPVLFKIPAEYAPKTNISFISHQIVNATLINIGVLANGDVILQNGTINANTYYSLDHMYIKED